MSTETVWGLETYATLMCSRLVSLHFSHSLFSLQINNYRVGVASSDMKTGQLFARTTHRESKQTNNCKQDDQKIRLHCSTKHASALPTEGSRSSSQH